MGSAQEQVHSTGMERSGAVAGQRQTHQGHLASVLKRESNVGAANTPPGTPFTMCLWSSKLFLPKMLSVDMEIQISCLPEVPPHCKASLRKVRLGLSLGF